MPNCNRCSDLEMAECKLTKSKIIEVLKTLKPDRAHGPDNLSSRVLIELGETIVDPLYFLFKQSLENGELPRDWCDAIVIPIFKKGAKNEPANYRPVSLTCITCKLMEQILRDHIMHYLLTNNLISDHQYGFLPGRSCTLQLLVVMDMWTQQLDLNFNIDIIYTDLKKAFDSVSHLKLLTKLLNLGFDNKIYQWIRAFLLTRRQRVRIEDEMSEWVRVWSGVPQGSVLGLVLFLVYINDIVDVIRSSDISLFADDAKLGHVVSSDNDRIKLQEDIDSMENWADTWSLQFNPKKCKVLHLGKNNPNYDYTMTKDKLVLDNSDAERDLGVVIDSALSFSNHINEIVSKANRILGLIKRNFKYLDENSFLNLYKTLVRPILEYASPVWNPHQMKYIKLIEGVQRRGTKLLSSIQALDYPKRLEKLKLPTLQFRRLRTDLIQVYKIMSGKDNINPEKMFVLSRNTRTRGHKFKIEKQGFRTNLRQYFFSNRIINQWNSLPANVVESPNIASFKTGLENHLKNCPMSCSE